MNKTWKQIKHGILHALGLTLEQRMKKRAKGIVRKERPDLDERRRRLYDLILFNQLYHGAHETNIDTTEVTLILLDNLIHYYVVGVQPMAGPVCLVYKMRTYEATEEEMKERGLTPSVKEGPNKGKNIILDVINKAVEAPAIRLNTGWTAEADVAMDADELHGVDLAYEIALAVGSEMAHEYNQRILSTIKECAIQDEIDFTQLKITEMPHQAQFQTVKAGIAIAKSSLRGIPTFYIMSPGVYSLFEMRQSDSGFEIEKLEEAANLGGFQLIGHVKRNDQRLPVFVEIMSTEDYLLCGYKNQDSEVDVGMLWCPYFWRSYKVLDEDEEKQSFGESYKVNARWAIRGADEREGQYYHYTKVKITEPVEEAKVA